MHKAVQSLSFRIGKDKRNEACSTTQSIVNKTGGINELCRGE